jgi:serine/threonine protein kinase
MVPQYEILCLLGRGGMGAVYQGRQISLDRLVAIKILSNDLEEADANFAERFKNEARAMAKLTHPGIVSVYDFGETPNGLLYIVMEFVEGTDVQKMISASRRLHTEHAMAITAHVCDALAYAHERGIIHRDIKPANIMVGYDGSVKVADFGLAKVSTGGQTVGLTQSGIAMGTLHFMAPEALMLGTAVDHRADIYAVGVMLYQMLTGKLPQGMFELPSIQVQGLDPRYDGIIAKALREDREVRYQSAKAMRQDLDAILTQPVVKLEPAAAGTVQQPAVAALPTQARPQRPGAGQPYRPPQPRPQTAPPQPTRSFAWVWVLVLILAGAGGWFFFTPRDQAKTSATPVPAAPMEAPKVPSTPAPMPTQKVEPIPTPKPTAPPAAPVPAPTVAAESTAFGGHRYQFVPSSSS